MNIDSHQHFWIYSEKEYSWINEQMEILKHDFLPPDLEIELKREDFDGSIAVQARQTYEETRWLLQLAESNNFIKGVVGWVDLCSSDVRCQLTELVAFPKLVGVRHVVQDEPDDDFILRKDFLNGIGCLKEFNLSYDILIFPRHLKNTIQFVKQFPEQTFIIDHMAKPNIREKLLSPWKEDISQLARFPNVFCKLSGMVTEADWFNWKESDIKVYLDVIVEAFGTSRIMIGSDWPVCRLGGSYSNVMGIVKNYFSGFPETEKKFVLGLNAEKAYGIKQMNYYDSKSKPI
jgi:L-fuconolactonase